MEHLQVDPCSSLRHLQGLLTFAGSAVGVVPPWAVRKAVIPQEQVAGVLALQADAAGAPQVGHAPAAPRVAVWGDGK